MNVVVYGPKGQLWALRESAIGDKDRGRDGVSIGRSRMEWRDDTLHVHVDEITTPFAKPLRGTICFRPTFSNPLPFALDDEGQHLWWPISPAGKLDVAFEQPAIRFVGNGYHDVNAGDVPLEASFARWTWSRAHLDEGRTCVSYDVTDRRGNDRRAALEFTKDRVNPLHSLQSSSLGRTSWRLRRVARVQKGHRPHVVRELEDTPFYSRAVIETAIQDRPVIAIHETLSLERLEQRWVRFLMRFRMGKGP